MLDPDDPCAPCALLLFDSLVGLVEEAGLSLPCRDCRSVELELLELLEIDESGLDELPGLDVSIDPLALPDPEMLPEALPEIVESCDAVPVAVPLCGYCDEAPLCSEPELDVAELPCEGGVELSVTEPETLELEDDELGGVEFNVPLADPLGAPEPDVLIDVLL